MKLKNMSRNKESLPINFCETDNFLNLSKIKKFIPMKNSLNVKKQKKIYNKFSILNLSENQNIQKEEMVKKDELIQKLKEKIILLENKIKYLEKEITIRRSRNDSFNNTLILKQEKSYQINNNKNKTNIPLDRYLFKGKIIKNKKNLFGSLKINKPVKSNKCNSFHRTENDKSKKSYKTRNLKILNNTNSINHSLTNYNTRNNSISGSPLISKKKAIKLNSINSYKSFIYYLSSKNSASKIKKNYSIEQMKKNVKINTKKNINKKIKDIPKKGRINQNISPLLMLSSTNYSNNISNLFKEETINSKKNNSINKNDKSNYNNISFNDIKYKLENIKNRTKNLLGIYSKLNINKTNNNNENSIKNKEKTKYANYSHFIKICKLEKVKK